MSTIQERDQEEVNDSSQSMFEVARENQARVLAGTGSPKVLIGGINLTDTPNFHTREMIDLGASIVSVSLEPKHSLRPDRLYCPPNVSLDAAIGVLPSKWRPDFFWDSQVEQGHYLPVGTGELDCPTVVSFNHANLGQALLHMRGMFDCVIAPSAFMAQWGDAVLPWGASWGTMGTRIKTFGRSPKGGPRDITVSCTIGAHPGAESVRHAVIAEVRAIAERRKDWNVVVLHGASLSEYYDVLRRSKVSINVGSWGSAMTYRPLEVIEQGAILVHVDETGYGSSSPLSEVFPESWYVSAKAETLESSIQAALERQNVAIPVRNELRARYSYARQYSDLFQLAGTVKRKKRLEIGEWSRRAFAVNYLTGYEDCAELHTWALKPEDKASMHEYLDFDWDVSLWKPSDKEAYIRWQTDLARKEEPHRETYRRYAFQPSTQE